MRNLMKFVLPVFGIGLLFGASPVQAVPALQLYIEGAVYDTVTETWVLSPTGPLDTITVWTIANVDGAGGVGAINDVRLSIAYVGGNTPTFTLAGSDTGGLGGWVDPTVAADGTYIQTVTDGSSPVLGDGSSLPSHGIYGYGVDWQEFGLGNFTETTSSITDVITTFPTAPPALPLGGHINVYDITISGGAGLELHFDLYDTIVASDHAKFAPFSHDGATGGVIPAPGAALLALIGFPMVAWVRKRAN